MSDALQTVSFKARTSNSSTTPTPEPKRRSSDGPLLIAIFNGFGIGWILWDHPAIALLIAASIASVSVSMRRNSWARGLSWVASSAVAAAFIMHPPVLSPRPSHYRHAERVELDQPTKAVLYLVAVVLFGMVHKVVGEPDPISAAHPMPTAPKPPEDPSETAKKKGFNAWLASDRVTISDKDEPTTPVDQVFASYERYLASMTFPPPPEVYFSLAGFKSAFKAVAKKEVVDVKGIPSYQGVSLA